MFFKMWMHHSPLKWCDKSDLGWLPGDREDATFQMIRKHREIEMSRFESIMAMMKEDHLSRLVSLEYSALRTLENTSQELFNVVKAEKIQLAISLEHRTKTLHREAAKMGEAIKKFEEKRRRRILNIL